MKKHACLLALLFSVSVISSISYADGTCPSMENFNKCHLYWLYDQTVNQHFYPTMVGLAGITAIVLYCLCDDFKDLMGSIFGSDKARRRTRGACTCVVDNCACLERDNAGDLYCPCADKGGCCCKMATG